MYFSNGPNAAASIAPNLNPTGTGRAYVNKVIFFECNKRFIVVPQKQRILRVRTSFPMPRSMPDDRNPSRQWVKLSCRYVEIPPPIGLQQSSLRAFAAAEADILPHISITATAATTPFYSAAHFSSGVVRSACLSVSLSVREHFSTTRQPRFTNL